MRRALIHFAVVLLGCARAPAETPLQRLSQGSEHWNDWIELVPAIKLPTRADRIDDVRVYAQFRPGSLIELAGPSNRSLRVPFDSEFDRVERWTQNGLTRVVDVRGTLFSAEGEVFHVYRPLRGVLSGQSWRRADSPPLPTLQTLMALAGGSPTSRQHFAERLHCATCHGHNRQARGTTGDGAPRRPTDDSGLYSLLATLSDRSVVETYKAFDPNRNEPFVEYSCATPDRLHHSASEQHCPAGELLYASFDLRAALRANNRHANDVCGARRRLAPYLSAQVRAAYQNELSECGR